MLGQRRARSQRFRSTPGAAFVSTRAAGVQPGQLSLPSAPASLIAFSSAARQFGARQSVFLLWNEETGFGRCCLWPAAFAGVGNSTSSSSQPSQAPPRSLQAPPTSLQVQELCRWLQLLRFAQSQKQGTIDLSENGELIFEPVRASEQANTGNLQQMRSETQISRGTI